MSRNLIFTCVFHEDRYLRFFYLLLESIQLFGNLQQNTDLLVYTSSHFEKKIRESNLYQSNILFHINNTYDTTDKAAKARLDLFDIPIIQNYQKILYLDTDIIIRRSLQPIFDIITDLSKPLFYTLKEGSIDHPSDFWGKSLFEKNVINKYTDRSAFTSGILLFLNHPMIKQVFDDIKDHILKNKNKGFYDQPYFVYHAFKNEIYDNIILEKYAENENGRGHSIDTTKTILHFCGGLGVPKSKQMRLEFMQQFMFQTKKRLIDHFIDETRKIIDSTLMPIINATGEKLEGNIFTEHLNKNYTNKFDHKRRNLALVALNPNMKFGLEIGFNAGFSTLLMLITNSNLHMTCVDLGEHQYTRPCFEAIEKMFPGRVEIHLGDSMQVMPTIQKTDYDFVHIDGCHLVPIAESDIIHSYRIAKKGAILIFDDYDFKHLHVLWDKYIKKYNLRGLNTFIHTTPFHDIRCIPNI